MRYRIPLQVSAYNREHGIALVMSLVFLLLLTIIGLASVTTSSLEDKMTGNTQDRNIAFQAAETALLAGENWIANQGTAPSVANTVKGLYDSTTPPITPLWESVMWDNSNATNKVVVYPCTPTTTSSCGTTLGNVATQPKYIVEILGQASAGPPPTYAFRVTARGTGGRDTSVVMLQSTYIRQ